MDSRYQTFNNESSSFREKIIFLERTYTLHQRAGWRSLRQAVGERGSVAADVEVSIDGRRRKQSLRRYWSKRRKHEQRRSV
jgi:hypothetical protein